MKSRIRLPGVFSKLNSPPCTREKKWGTINCFVTFANFMFSPLQSIYNLIARKQFSFPYKVVCCTWDVPRSFSLVTILSKLKQTAIKRSTQMIPWSDHAINLILCTSMQWFLIVVQHPENFIIVQQKYRCTTIGN